MEKNCDFTSKMANFKGPKKNFFNIHLEKKVVHFPTYVEIFHLAQQSGNLRFFLNPHPGPLCKLSRESNISTIPHLDPLLKQEETNDKDSSASTDIIEKTKLAGSIAAGALDEVNKILDKHTHKSKNKFIHAIKT